MNINTLRKILVTLGQILNYAVRHRYIDHNPLRDAERPRGKGDEGEFRRDKIRILSPDQIRSLLDKVSDRKFKALLMVAIFTGVRQGELLGLKWSDVDWESSQIHVQRTFTKGEFFATKTRSSNRRVDLAPKATKALKEWKLACPRTKLDLIFPNEAGRPMNYSNMMDRVFKPALKAAKLPRIRFHDLRHTPMQAL